MIFRKILPFALCIMLILSTGCSKEPTVSESSSESSSVQIIISPAEPSESSSSEESSLSSMSSVSEETSSSESVPETSSIPETSSLPETSSSETEEPSSKDYGTLILVNPWNYIPEDYTLELETVQGKYKMDIKAAESARNLVAAAKEAGFNMQLCSAYRTVEKSAELYQRKVNQYIGYGYSEADAKVEAAKWVAPPGTSEHHTGLAMDLVSSDYWNYYSDLEHDYEKFDSFKWMYEHCAEFGFILRYPKDKQDITGITYEPWHYRYVGIEAAKYIMENGLCLEEYLEIIK
ncbi:MAG: M15 family metallopeptidase [Oscillospiraceae bacterium]|nr:M15 family metallopeptidase [Oscillospiraceae bacterium]MBP1575315.1 M15 family metallopeptidase [Oscillospiraceae bacterium]